MRSNLLVVLLMLSLSILPVSAQTKNSFDLSASSIPADEIRHGGPPRDGIPSIDIPIFWSADEADFLRPGDRVLGVVREGLAKAYPIRILNWHEVVNDTFGDEAIAVTFCPLCGTGMAFRAEIDGRRHEFGVSGLLYNSDVLLYDRTTESLWSQIAQEAVSGPLVGRRLEMVPTAHTSWADWRERYPDTLVLSTETGFQRDYDRDPYAGYETSASVMFPVAHSDARYHPKEWVVGLNLDSATKAYPFSELEQVTPPLTDTVAGRQLTVEFDAAHRSARILDERGEEIPTVAAFWFAWVAFHPDTAVYVAP